MIRVLLSSELLFFFSVWENDFNLSPEVFCRFCKKKKWVENRWEFNFEETVYLQFKCDWRNKLRHQIPTLQCCCRVLLKCLLIADDSTCTWFDVCGSSTYITEKVEGLCQSHVQHANTLSKQLVQVLPEVLVKREFEDEGNRGTWMKILMFLTHNREILYLNCVLVKNSIG